MVVGKAGHLQRRSSNTEFAVNRMQDWPGEGISSGLLASAALLRALVRLQ